MPDPTPTAVAAPPTAQEALEAFGEIENDCSMPMGKTPAGIAAALGVLRAFIESAAAEAGAWAKIEAWLIIDRKQECAIGIECNGKNWEAFLSRILPEDDGTGRVFYGPTRLAALQLAAAWCEKEGV